VTLLPLSSSLKFFRVFMSKFFGEATSSQPSLEAIDELTVLSNNFSAEYAGISVRSWAANSNSQGFRDSSGSD
jgi:hypothetical protein